jgi:hypothetical protein
MWLIDGEGADGFCVRAPAAVPRPPRGMAASTTSQGTWCIFSGGRLRGRRRGGRWRAHD